MRERIGRFNVAIWLGWTFLALSTAPALAAPGIEPPRPLTEQGIQNLTAFTRLLGYIRFFHPSDQAAAADWNQIAIAGVQDLERAANPDDLAWRLEDFFRPVAPTLRVYRDGERPALPEELRPPSGLANPQVTYWFHTGVGLPETVSSYSSVRSVANGRPPSDTGLPQPEQPLEVSLGAGVSALIPLTLYRDAQGATIPAVDFPLPRPDKPRGFQPSGNDRVTRLAAVALAWPVFQHFYPYFDVVSADWPAELRKALASAAKDRTEQAFADTLRRMMVSLEDGHASVAHGSAVRTHQLPLTWDVVEGQWVITSVDARQARGLDRGDIILSFNGKPAAEALAAAASVAPGATPQLIRFRSLLLLMVGPRNEAVRLRVQKASGRTANVTVRRSLPLVDGRISREPRPDKISEVQPGIFYVDINRISDEDLEAALPMLLGARGIVFDLRGYPHNLTTVLLAHLASSDVRSPTVQIPLITLPDRPAFRFDQRSWTEPPLSPRLTARVAWLTNGEAISYAETYMGMVEGNRLGAIVGEPTAGTNGTVNYCGLPGGYTLRFTGMRVLRHDGSLLHGVGIPPTVPASRTLEGVRAGRDEVLEKGIETVQ